MFTDLHIEGLCGVGRVELRFDSTQRVRTLFGSNGVGKTKCLEAIYQALLFSNRLFCEGNDGAKGEIWKHRHFVMTSVAIDHSEVFKLPKEDSFFSREMASAAIHDRPVVYLGARNRATLESGNAASLLVGTFERRRKDFFTAVKRHIVDQRVGGSGMVTDVPSWFVTRAQSANPFQQSADNLRSEIETVLEMLHALDSRIDPQHLTIDGDGRVFLLIDGQSRALDELSSGFTSLVKLIQSIVSGYASWSDDADLRNLPGIVLIDEIESHLHAKWQVGMIPCLKRLLPNTTFFVATHSPLVLVQLQQGEAYLLQRDADDVVRSSVIEAPDRKAFADVLDSALGIDLNALKRAAMTQDDQSDAKRRLLELLDKSRKATS